MRFTLLVFPALVPVLETSIGPLPWPLWWCRPPLEWGVVDGCCSSYIDGGVGSPGPEIGCEYVVMGGSGTKQHSNMIAWMVPSGRSGVGGVVESGMDWDCVCVCDCDCDCEDAWDESLVAGAVVVVVAMSVGVVDEEDSDDGEGEGGEEGC